MVFSFREALLASWRLLLLGVLHVEGFRDFYRLSTFDSFVDESKAFEGVVVC